MGIASASSGRLDEAGIAYAEIDVDAFPHHGERIVEASGGYRVVPTVEVDGDLLVNPTLKEIRAARGRGH
ncbi:MAG: glutaredoxin family protein [Actinomycetota bacterium]